MVSRTGTGGDQDFRSQRHALTVSPGQQALRDDALQGVPQTFAQIIGLALAQRDDAIHGARDIRRVQRGEHEVASLCGLERDLHRLRVADLSHLG